MEKTYIAPQIVEYGSVQEIVRAVAKGSDILEGNFQKTYVPTYSIQLPTDEE